MAESGSEFRPDYNVTPGEILEETLAAIGMRKSELARRCGRPIKTISEIVSGKTSITAETAIQFERVLGVPASFWTNLESQFQLRRAEQSEMEKLAQHVDWANQFPIREMVKFGSFSNPKDERDSVEKLLDFFRVATVEAWHQRFDEALVSYRRSAAFTSSPEAVAAWLQLGEVSASRMDCNPYDGALFRECLQEDVRHLTREGLDVWRPRLLELCRNCGVAIVFVPELPGTRLSGAARWVAPDKALIQLSLRHKTDDHLWFTFFHEAGHIILHGKKEVFIDEEEAQTNDKEKEADRFATNILIPPTQWRSFVKGTKYFSRSLVEAFAEHIGIAPGVVVGRLQYEKRIPFTHLNGLKRRFQWQIGSQ